jgi:nucleolar protein 4
VIFPDTPAASTLSAAELEKRVQAFNTRRTLMRSNPSLYLSKTRISVRQLPTFATERTLKRLAVHAVRTFEEDVKSGVREGLTADEMREIGDDNTPEMDGEMSSKKRKRKRGERQTAVRQAKIVRVSDRIDPITSKGRSKGYGFLEMMSHADALRVIRWANNHPGVEGLMRGWWKEELQDMEKKDHGKKMNEEEEARVRRMKDRLRELEEDKEKKVGRSLVLEFSIENIQVVRRRVEREEGSRQVSLTS